MTGNDAQYKDETKRTKKRKVFEDETRENEIELSGCQNFKVNVFYVICDGLAQELKRRLESYSEVESTFKCFLQTMTTSSMEPLTNLSA